MSKPTFQFQRRVEFCETDAAGIAHFSAFVQYMEQAEHALLRSLGLRVFAEHEEGGHLSWPRVHIECDYQGTARFEDVLNVSVAVEKLGTKSVTYRFHFRREGSPDILAAGKIVAVCCRVETNQPLASVEIPAHIRRKLSEHLE